MFKKVTKLLLVFVLVLQIIFPALVANADDYNDLMEQQEADYYSTPVKETEQLLDLDSDGEVYDESTVEVDSDDQDETTELIESEDESEPNEGLAQIREIFSDPELARMIAIDLELTVDSYIDVLSIKSLYVDVVNCRDCAAITSIEGMQYLINLESLVLNGREVSDITPLENLTNLHMLILSDNQISDISSLANLTNLTRLALDENLGISDISSLANLINLTRLSLGENQISDIAPLVNLVNLRSLSLGGNLISNIASLENLANLQELWLLENQITDLRPLGNLNLRTLSVSHQTITLPTVELGEATRIEFFLPNGDRIEEFTRQQGSFKYSNGMLTWLTPGSNHTFFNVSSPIDFSATISQEVIGDEDDNPNRASNIPQASIDLMYAFIEKNSADNPFVVPAGSTFNEEMNALDWGEGIIVLTPMSGLQAPEGTIWGSIFLQHEEDEDFEYAYGFFDIGLFVQFEDDDTENKTPPPTRPSLPQTGSVAANGMLVGLGTLATAGLLTYRKMKKD